MQVLDVLGVRASFQFGQSGPCLFDMSRARHGPAEVTDIEGLSTRQLEASAEQSKRIVMSAKPGVDAAGEIQGDEIVGIDLERLLEIAKAVLASAVKVMDGAGKTVDVRIEWIELLRAARLRQCGGLASWPCRPGQPDVRQAVAGVE